MDAAVGAPAGEGGEEERSAGGRFVRLSLRSLYVVVSSQNFSTFILIILGR